MREKQCLKNKGERKTKVPGEAPAKAPPCLTQMLHLPPWERTRVYGVRGERLTFRTRRPSDTLQVIVGASNFVATQFHSQCRYHVDCGLFLSGKKSKVIWLCVMTSYIALTVVISHQSRHYSIPELSTHTNDFRSAAVPSRNRYEAVDLAS
jgi:hypothetical protein